MLKLDALLELQRIGASVEFGRSHGVERLIVKARGRTWSRTWPAGDQEKFPEGEGAWLLVQLDVAARRLAQLQEGTVHERQSTD